MMDWIGAHPVQGTALLLILSPVILMAACVVLWAILMALVLLGSALMEGADAIIKWVGDVRFRRQLRPAEREVLEEMGRN